MCNRLLTLVTIAAFAQTSVAEKRTIACKTPEIASLCYPTHGRLAIYNGSPPNLRLWEIASGHLLGIYSGKAGMHYPSPSYDYNEDFGTPHLPAAVAEAFHIADPFNVLVFADFEVCPLEPHIAGHMQAACIESATHIFVKKD